MTMTSLILMIFKNSYIKNKNLLFGPRFGAFILPFFCLATFSLLHSAFCLITLFLSHCTTAFFSACSIL